MPGVYPSRCVDSSSVSASFRPSGVLVPLVTPFDERGAVDIPALQSLAARALEAGAAGIVALATTGEPTSLDDGERAAVVTACAGVCAPRGAALVVGAGTNDTRTTIARHEALADVPGATASLAVVPYYVRPSEDAIVRHFQAVAERSPVPLIVYNIPYRTGRGLGASALIELAATPNVAGVKQAVGCIDADTLRVLGEAGDRFAVLGGDDAFLLPLVLMGGAGAIAASANLCTGQFCEMIARGLRGDLPGARPIAEALLPLVGALFAEPSPAVIKAALHALGRIPTAAVRMPLSPASPAGAARALELLRHLEP
jgi:4-hydroxy-tetrahydrodipicolinate synthase